MRTRRRSKNIFCRFSAPSVFFPFRNDNASLEKELSTLRERHTELLDHYNALKNELMRVQKELVTNGESFASARCFPFELDRNEDEGRTESCDGNEIFAEKISASLRTSQFGHGRSGANGAALRRIGKGKSTCRSARVDFIGIERPLTSLVTAEMGIALFSLTVFVFLLLVVASC